MSIILSSAVQSSGAADSISLKYARLAVLRVSGTVSASTEETDYPASRADTPHTYGGWKPTSVPANWEIDLGSAEDVNYCCVAGHNIGSSGATVKPQYWDGASWQDATGSDSPSDDEPLLFLFDTISASKWRLYVTVSVCTISVIKFGTVSVPERQTPPPFSPAVWNPNNEYTNQMSEGGQILGRIKRRRGLSQQIVFNKVSVSWINSNWETLREAMEEQGVCFAWSPDDQLSHLIYGMVEDSPSVRYTDSKQYVDIRFRVKGP